MVYLSSLLSNYPFMLGIILILVIIAMHLQRPAETLHFYQNMVSLICFAIGKHAPITFKLFWFIRPPYIEISTFKELQKKSSMPVKSDTFNNLEKTLDTGDIVLFFGYNTFPYYVASKWSYASPISHIGIVIRNEKENLQIFEASLNDGVALKDLKTRIETYPSELIAVRRIKDYVRTEEFHNIVNRFIDDHYAKEHDLKYFDGKLEMIKSAVDLHIPFTNKEVFKNNHEAIDRFFCSELVALLFSQLGLLTLRAGHELLTSSEFTPPDFSNFGNYTLRKKEVEKQQLFHKFEDEIFFLKKDTKTLVD